MSGADRYRLGHKGATAIASGTGTADALLWPTIAATGAVSYVAHPG